MEIIRKKINIECVRSRQQGLVPFIKYNDLDSTMQKVTTDKTDGNYGSIPYNIIKSGTTEVVSYMDIMYRYNKVYNILYNGVRLKKINDKEWTNCFENKNTIYDYAIGDKSLLKETDNEFTYYMTESVYDCDNGTIMNFVDNIGEVLETCKFLNQNDSVKDFMGFVDKKLIGKLLIPYNIQGSKVPEFLHYCDIKEWADWFSFNEPFYYTDCCIKQEWEDKGGNEMRIFLEENKTKYEDAIKNFDYENVVIPYIPIFIFLTQKTENIGVMSADLSEEIYLSKYPKEKTNNSETNKSEEIYSESRLLEVRSNRKYYDDNGELLDVLLLDDNGKLYENNKTPNSFKYPYIQGVIINLSYNRYYDKYGNALYKKDNKGKVEMRGNVIKEITEENGYITFDYLINAVFNIEYTATTAGNAISVKDDDIISNGIEYKETYKLIQNKMAFTYKGEKYELSGSTIDYNSNKQKVYSQELGLYREVCIAKIIDYQKTDSFVPLSTIIDGDRFYYIEDNTKECNLSDVDGYDENDNEIKRYKSYDIPIYKEDSLNGITASIIEKVDVSIDRGVANAFETHYKLSECSTFDDLENYGNNYFNL